jgi:AcrR family transcriptional regulator
LYQYFPGKSVILAELLRQERATLLSRIEQAICQVMNKRSFEDSLRAIIDSAVDHQLGRPRLALSLGYVQATLPLGEETFDFSVKIVERVAAFFAGYEIPNADIAARGVVALSKGIIDTAGLAGETDHPSLVRRVYRAATSYL